MAIDDSKLWAHLADEVAGGTGLPLNVAEMISRRCLAVVRRTQFPGRRTWAPGDNAPATFPASVFNVDGDVYELQPSGVGCYRMSATSRARYSSDSDGRFEGVRPWPFLLADDGPLTESEPSKQEPE